MRLSVAQEPIAVSEGSAKPMRSLSPVKHVYLPAPMQCKAEKVNAIYHAV